MGAFLKLSDKSAIQLDSEVTELLDVVRTDFPSLRYYQLDALSCAIARILRTLDPILLELPTAAGKSWIIAGLACLVRNLAHQRSGKPKKVLVLAPSGELVEQNHGKMVAAGFEASMFSASVNQKSVAAPVVFGSPRSVLGSIEEFTDGDVDYTMLVIDEAHSLPPTVIEIIEKLRKANPYLRIVGLTATPYQMGNGYIYRQDVYAGEPPLGTAFARSPFFGELVYRISASELIQKGYLVPPLLGDVSDQYDTQLLERTATGGWTESSARQVYVQGKKSLTKRIVADIVRKAKRRSSRGVMIFAHNIEQAQAVMEFLPKGQAGIITKDTKTKERKRTLKQFLSQRLLYIVNVRTLTTGFDAPHVDMIAILRATESVSLLQQIIGRGLRPFLEGGKRNCLILDYAHNIERFCPDGDVFSPRIVAAQPSVNSGSAPEFAAVQCPDCGGLNAFKKSRAPRGFGLDRHGHLRQQLRDNYLGAYLLDPLGRKIAGHAGSRCLTYGLAAEIAEKVPELHALLNGRSLIPTDELPENFQALLSIAGVSQCSFQRCTHTWRNRVCGICREANSPLNDYCEACASPLTRYARKLGPSATANRESPYAERAAEVLSWQLTCRRSSKGNDTLQIAFQIREFPYIIRNEATGELMPQAPEPEHIRVWLTPGSKHPDAIKAWESFQSYLAAYAGARETAVPFSIYEQIKGASLAPPAPRYIRYRAKKSPATSFSGNAPRTFYEIVRFDQALDAVAA